MRNLRHRLAVDMDIPSLESLDIGMPMTADYAESLKRAWKACPCTWEVDTACSPKCACLHSNPRYASGYAGKIIPCQYALHAALLEMVDGYHVKGCECWDRAVETRECLGEYDPYCLKERCRLRASVGVSDDH